MALGNVLNPEFSIAGAAAGQAADWTEAYSGDGAGTGVTVEESACFTHSGGIDQPFESFENSWPEFSFWALGPPYPPGTTYSHESVADFDAATSESALFEWQSGLLPYSGALSAENFETSWCLPSIYNSLDPRFNHQSIFEFFESNFEDAGIESFETNWDSNQNGLIPVKQGGTVPIFAGAIISDASFDTGTPQAFEDFEEEWHSNENFVVSLDAGTAVSAAWDLGGLDLAEDFENQWTTTYP